ncbi:MAG: SDR family NAD(P)-dependent oxidoreductase [Nitrospirota bacterium]
MTDIIIQNEHFPKTTQAVENTPLSNRPVVLITGASSGIGEAIAILYAQNGADLILVARRTERLKALSEKISRVGQRVIFYHCDVANDLEIKNVVSEARAVMGKIDIVIANAGFGVRGALASLLLADYQRLFETNVFGVIRTIYATLDDLKKSRGRLVVVGSVLGHIALPESSAYVMSKFALRGLCESIRPELSSYGVSVTLISPGLVESEFRKVNRAGLFDASLKESVPEFLVMPARQAAAAIIQAVSERRGEAIITTHAKIMVFLNRLFPRLFLAMAEWLNNRTKDNH